MEEAILAGLLEPSPRGKVAAARHAATLWRDREVGGLLATTSALAPDRPARPEHPVLAPPREVPRRRLGSEAGRIALLHALAHIELNAIDLALDMALRFARECEAKLGRAEEFTSDWLKVAEDEALHFELLEDRLQDLGSHYGALKAHDGLWQAALATKNHWRARLCVVPMVLEARGLDVTPGTIVKLRDLGDKRSADILQQIYTDEITHVRTGVKWFQALCALEEISEEEAFNKDLEDFFKGTLKGPFNEEARSEAGLSPNLYRTNAQ